MFILNNTEGEESERNSINEPETEFADRDMNEESEAALGGHQYVEGSQSLCLLI